MGEGAVGECSSRCHIWENTWMVCGTVGSTPGDEQN